MRFPFAIADGQMTKSDDMVAAPSGSTDNPFYDGRTVLLPLVGELRPGDILLTRATSVLGPGHGVQSKGIRLATWGAFSHALICSEPPIMIEAIGTGVSTLSLGRCYAHDWRSVRVLRHPDPSVAQDAARAAQLQVGRDYSVRRAIRAAFPKVVADRLADTGIFCSALVAQSYVGAGEALFAATPIERTTPATIERIEGLEDVTRLLFREGLAPRNLRAMVPLDAHAPPSPSARQTAISGRYAKALMSDAEALADQMPGQLDIVPTHFGLLDLVMDGLKAADAVRPPNTMLTDAARQLDHGLAKRIRSGELAEVHADLQRIEGAELASAVKASFDPAPDIDVAAMQALLLTTLRELDVRRRAASAMEAWNGPGNSEAVAAYVELERGAIGSMEMCATLFREILDRIG